ncbi:PucR family transcriptional regulator [Rhodococcoides kyotonense]|uniref:PucR C-terminal helix-turn-helix domain-containing protein n=1 Tax=Rhodococcoides kyotonense TaxID=398843 RepID=A0A239K449_9NOCA|nr:PucR family transcriptional regulator [Rhodococcus kyotonensis]SNT12548.1 PucR C-terminal helix-turn-helix domain-containing protein [Rhodococcus kyotonensis]
MLTSDPAADCAGSCHRQLHNRFDDLTRRHDLETALAESLGGGSDFADLFGVIVDRARHTLWLFDTRGGEVASSVARVGGLTTPKASAILEDVIRTVSRTSTPAVVDARVSVGPARRYLVDRVVNGTDVVGWLVMAEVRHPFDRFDRHFVERAAAYLSMHHRLHRAVRRSISDLTVELADRLIKGHSETVELREEADRLGVDLTVFKVVVLVDDSRVVGKLGDATTLARRLSARTRADVIGTRTAHGIALLVDVNEGDRHGVVDFIKRAVLALSPKDGVQAGISAVCSPVDISDAYAEACEVVECLDRFDADHSRVVTAHDLGPARVLVANGNIASIRRYVQHTLGALWNSGEDEQVLLDTLVEFSHSGHSVRKTATAMAVHENTVRQRISRVKKLTGLDVASDPSDQLAVHTALTIVTLRNRPHPLWQNRNTRTDGVRSVIPRPSPV